MPAMVHLFRDASHTKKATRMDGNLERVAPTSLRANLATIPQAADLAMPSESASWGLFVTFHGPASAL